MCLFADWEWSALVSLSLLEHLRLALECGESAKVRELKRSEVKAGSSIANWETQSNTSHCSTRVQAYLVERKGKKGRECWLIETNALT